jgi:hypothetical protein
MSLNTVKFRVRNAANFFDGMAGANTFYMAIGRPTAWSNETSPPTPTDAVANTTYDYWRDIIGYKRLFISNACHVTPRHNWSANTVYVGYDHRDDTLTAQTFYVLSSSFNVYKCLFNNYSANSTVEPSGTGNTVITTGDGYKWKFMYTIDTTTALDFLTDNFMPVKTLTSDDGSTQWKVQQYAATSNGAVDVILVTAGGTNYAPGTTTVSIAGDGTGATATATVSGNVVTAITVTGRGSNYSRANVTISSSGSGSGATAVAIIPPKGYHGSDPVEEFGAHYLMLTGRFITSESNTISTNTFFRRIMLVENPLLTSNGAIATGTSYQGTLNLTLTSPSGTFTSGETVTGGTSGATGVVVDWNEPGNTNVLRVITVTGTFTNTELITGGTSLATGTLFSQTAMPIKWYTGNILYVEQRSPIGRATDQTEVLRVVLAY